MCSTSSLRYSKHIRRSFPASLPRSCLPPSRRPTQCTLVDFKLSVNLVYLQSWLFHFRLRKCREDVGKESTVSPGEDRRTTGGANEDGRVAKKGASQDRRGATEGASQEDETEHAESCKLIRQPSDKQAGPSHMRHFHVTVWISEMTVNWQLFWNCDRCVCRVKYSRELQCVSVSLQQYKSTFE